MQQRWNPHALASSRLFGPRYAKPLGVPATMNHPQVLVGGFKPSDKNMKVSWDDDIPNIWENKKCSKPPTRVGLRAIQPPFRPI